MNINSLRVKVLNAMRSMGIDNSHLPPETLTLLFNKNIGKSEGNIFKLKIMLLEAKRIQDKLSQVIFVKTFDFLPYLHVDIDGIISMKSLNDAIKKLKELGYLCKKKDFHSYTFANMKNNVEFELDFKIGLDGVCHLKYEDIKPLIMSHEVYNKLLGEEFLFNVPDVRSQIIIRLMNILDNKVVQVQDILELHLLGLKPREITYLLGSISPPYPKILRPEAYVRVLNAVLPYTRLEIKPLEVAGHFIHYLRTLEKISFQKYHEKTLASQTRLGHVIV
jgi:hypothetical protein